MGEEALLQLSQQFLQTPAGKSLLGSQLNLNDITNRIQDLSSKFNIDLSTLDETSLDNINLSLGSNLTREQKREKRRQKRLSAKEKLQERLDEANITKVDVEKKVRAEISLLKAKLKSQIPTLQTYTIVGRLQDKNTNTPLQGAKVTLGVNQDFVDEKVGADNPLNVSEELLPNKVSLDLNDLIFIPIPGQTARTDKQGNFSIKVKVPIIPENQKTPLVFGLLYSKSGYIPGTQAIINGDKTIKTNLSLTSLINLSEAAEEISQKFNDGIDLAQAGVAALAMDVLDKLIFAKKFSIGKLVDNIKTKLIPLAISLLLAFGISKLTQANRKTCPTPDTLNNVIRTRNRVVRQLNQLFRAITINTALALAFTALANVLRGVRLALDALPAPQAVGVFPAKDFGGLIFAQPYSFTAKLQHINDELEKLEEANKGTSRATLVSLIFLIAGVTTVILLLKSVDQMAQECAEENGVTNLELEAINQELLDLAEEEAEDGNPIIGNVNGFIFSVETDNKNPVGTLKRRFAVAKDSRGITLLKGEPSFSSSDQILIDELVFYIQQNNLKAN
tara:strand:+ start:34 stop:1719 length:1686 start_codon:yes stop_codon:yes gene_type:complete